MRSFHVALVAILLVSVTAQENYVRYRRESGEKGVRGVRPQYLNLADEVDADVFDRAQRRRMQKDKKENGDEQPVPPDGPLPETVTVVEEMELSMSMSMSM